MSSEWKTEDCQKKSWSIDQNGGEIRDDQEWNGSRKRRLLNLWEILHQPHRGNRQIWRRIQTCALQQMSMKPELILYELSQVIVDWGSFVSESRGRDLNLYEYGDSHIFSSCLFCIFEIPLVRWLKGEMCTTWLRGNATNALTGNLQKKTRVWKYSVRWANVFYWTCEVCWTF
jgi:hypothetical protein